MQPLCADLWTSALFDSKYSVFKPIYLSLPSPRRSFAVIWFPCSQYIKGIYRVAEEVHQEALCRLPSTVNLSSQTDEEFIVWGLKSLRLISLI